MTRRPRAGAAVPGWWLAALLLSVPATAAADHPPRWEETVRRSLGFEDPAAQRLLVVDGLWGGIRVEGSDGDTVEVVVRHVVRADDESAVERARREVTLEISRADGRIELLVDGPFRADGGSRSWRWNEWEPDFEAVFEFEIRVPRRIDLDLRTVLDGDVVVRGVEGRLDVANVVGDVRVRSVRPTGGSLETVSGEIDAELTSVPVDAMSFQTVSGNVEVVLPTQADADARLKSVWGELYSEFEVELLPVEPVVRKTDGGWSLGDATPAVRIGRGGPLLSFESLSGDIYLKRAGR